MKFFEKVIYCPNCKTEFDKSNPEFFECPNCGYKFFLNPVAANGAILLNNVGQVLLVERKFDPHKGMLDVAGGFLMTGESAEESLAREVKEELQIDIDPTNFSYVAAQPSKYNYQGQIIPTIDIVFQAKLPEGQTPIASDDADKIHFFEIKDIPLEKIAFDGIRKALEIYKNSH